MYDAYVLCAGPRSGSTLLCGLLKQTGQAGAPDSYFHRPSVPDWLADHGLDTANYTTRKDALRAVMKSAMERGRARTDLFGLRLQAHSRTFFMQQLAVLYPDLPDDRARLEAAFGRTQFIYLHRADKLAQAISYVKAEQSGLWHKAPDGRELERLSPHKDPAYDPAAIARRLQQAQTDDSDWEHWFSAQHITPLRIAYEDLADDPRREVARILTVLGQDAARAACVTPHVAPLRDALSAQWYARFREGN